MTFVNQENLDRLRMAITNAQPFGLFLPSVYVLELTNRCNINCIMCPNSKFKEPELGDVDERSFIRTLDLIAPYSELLMLYFMGEPTLHPRFASLLWEARKRLGGKIVVSTNAFNLSDEVVAALVENTDIVLICIDRWQEGAYEKIRRGSQFRNVVNSAEKILTFRAQSEFPKIIVKSLDISFRDENSESLERESDEFCNYWLQRGALPLFGWLNTWAGQFEYLKKFATNETPYTNMSHAPCADLWFKMVVNWRGEVVLCCHDWSSSVVVGDINANSLSSIWHSEKMVRFRNSHLEGDYGCTALCTKCAEWGEADELESYVRLNKTDLYRVF